MRRQKALIPALALFAVLLFLNLHGHPSHLWSPWDGWLRVFDGDRHSSIFFKNAARGSINYAHGWPCQFTLRVSRYSKTLGKGFPVSVIRDGSGASYGPWPFDGAPLDVFSGTALFLDLAFAFAMLGGIALASQYWPSWLGSDRISLKYLFVGTALVAVACAFEIWQFASIQSAKIAAMSYVGLNLVGILGTLPVVVRQRRFMSRDELIKDP